LIFDFRGIGESLHGELKDSTASINDWGILDIPAAVDTLLEKQSD
jgi:predicted alpha/beta hydrolase